MNIFWLRSANNDRNSIIEFIAKDNIDAALKLDDLIESACLKLQEFPNLGKKGRLKNSLELLIHPHYFLVYRIEDDRIEVLALVHTSRNFPFL